MSQASANAEIVRKYTPKPPKQVADAAANIDALIIAQKPPADGQPPAPDAQPPAAPPAGQQPPAPATPPAQPPAPPPAQAIPAQPPTGGEPPVGEDTWEARARSLHGRHENQLRINQGLTERLGQMEQLIANLQMTAPPAAAPTPVPPPRLLTEAEQTEFGPEFVDVVGRRAQEVFVPELSALDLRLKNIESRVEGVTAVTQQNAQERLYSTLSGAVPNWNEVNHSPEFKAWLAIPDPLSGRVRRDLLMEAFSRQEANRVVSFFSSFITEATGTPPAPPANLATPAPAGTPAQLNLADLAAPGRAGSGPQPVPPDKPLYTSASIAKFMHDKLTGKWKGRETDAALIEQDIFLAQHEGRIRV